MKDADGANDPRVTAAIAVVDHSVTEQLVAMAAAHQNTDIPSLVHIQASFPYRKRRGKLQARGEIHAYLHLHDKEKQAETVAMEARMVAMAKTAEALVKAQTVFQCWCWSDHQIRPAHIANHNNFVVLIPPTLVREDTVLRFPQISLLEHTNI